MGWKKRGSRLLGDFGVFKIRQDRYVVPRTGRLHELAVIESGDFVNVVALTPAGRVVMIRQFRAGTEDETLEIPGGMVEPGESPWDAARRELREESGYEAERWTDLGAIAPNPAIHSNRCHTFLAEGARPVGPPAPDEGEDIAVEERSLDEIPELLAQERISHALVAVAFQKLGLYRRGFIAAREAGGAPDALIP